MPEAIDDFLDALDNLIYEKSQPVMMATVTFMIEIVRFNKKYALKFKKYVSNLVRIDADRRAFHRPKYEPAQLKACIQKFVIH